MNEDIEKINKEYLQFSEEKVYNTSNNKENMKDKKKSIYIMIFTAIIFFVVGFIISDVINKGGAGQTIVKDKEIEDVKDVVKNIDFGEENVVKAKKNSLSVGDQFFGNFVIVKNIVLNKTSWIAVYEDLNGEPGNILGAGVLDSGKKDTLKIELLREMIGGSTYYIKIHPDNGDREFNYKEDISINNLLYSFKTLSGRPN